MKRKLLISFAFMVIMIVIMQWQGKVLRTDISRLGILDLEFAGSKTRLFELQTKWKANHVYTNIILDFFFILSYILFLYRGCIAWSARIGWQKAGIIAGFLAIAAGVLDVLENIFMMIAFSASSGTAIVAAKYMAAAKFILLGVVLLFIAFTLIRMLFRKQTVVHPNLEQ